MHLKRETEEREVEGEGEGGVVGRGTVQKVSHRLQQFTCIPCVTLGTLQSLSLAHLKAAHNLEKVKASSVAAAEHPRGALSINEQLVQKCLQVN